MTEIAVHEKEIPAEIELTGEQIARLADRHTLAVQFWLDTRAPEAEEHHGLGVRCGSTGIPIPLLNQALGGNYPQDRSPEEIREDIEGVIEFFKRRGMDWYWWVSPFSKPEDFGEYLRAYDMIAERDRPLPAMAAFLSQNGWPQMPEGVKVWQAESMEDLAAASAIRRAGFGFPDGIALDYFDAMPDSWLGNEEKVRLYLASANGGPPASMGALVYAEGIPGVYVMATLPGWGRRGLGTAVMCQIMAQARAEENQMIALTASRFGLGLYRKFGFQHVFDYQIYFKQKEVTE